MNTVKVRNVEIGVGIPKICVPIVGVTREEILAAAENIKSTKADVVEWRVDWYEDIFDFAKTEATMQALREVIGEMPILSHSAHPKKVEKKQSRQELMLN